MSRLAVVVVNHNTRAQLRDCLASLPAETEVVVVDNDSGDDSVRMVRDEFPHVGIVANRFNPGYGGGANQGVRRCDADYVLILNSDTLVEPGALTSLRRHLDDNPRVGLAGPRLRNRDGTLQPSCFPVPGTMRWLVENDPMGRLVGWVPPARRRSYRFNPPGEAGPVPWVLGAALAVRRSAFEVVGGFDESFFMYYEEVDLCMRLRLAGWEVHHVPTAEIVHLGAASTSQVRSEMAVEHFRSTLRFYRRYYRGVHLRAWVGIMRTKMLLRFLRDAMALALVREPSRQVRLRQNLSIWQRALRLKGF
jgi:N-acetylglucosaminyl-diphospho-decaprenol L-rhamnosyltransferase